MATPEQKHQDAVNNLDKSIVVVSNEATIGGYKLVLVDTNDDTTATLEVAESFVAEFGSKALADEVDEALHQSRGN